MLLRAVRMLSQAVLLLMFGTLAFAGDRHLLLGKWSVDVSRLQIPDPPRSVTLELTEAGEGAYHITVDIVYSDGSKSHGESTFKPDGSPAHGEGSADVDVVSMTMPSERILVMGAGFKGNPASTRVWYLVDYDNNKLQGDIRHTPDGTPYTITNTWNRQ